MTCSYFPLRFSFFSVKKKNVKRKILPRVRPTLSNGYLFHRKNKIPFPLKYMFKIYSNKITI